MSSDESIEVCLLVALAFLFIQLVAMCLMVKIGEKMHEERIKKIKEKEQVQNLFWSFFFFLIMPYMAIDKAIMRGEIRMHMINIEKIFICIISKLLSKKKEL